ncbi:MAG TPA: PKD domain-containing protein [Gemmatimonadales bacterium]|nr:PKD domain-containing protein [Gemmatimonadales bacterium]
MRPIRSLYLWCAPVVLSAALGCGKDSNGPSDGGDDLAPKADFSSTCSGLSCDFTDLSTDDGQVTHFAWEFGDGNGASNRNPSHTFSTGGEFSVTLTVTDDKNLEGSRSKTVSVSLPANGAPTADFSVTCSSLECSFTDLSTDADGTVVAWAWEFGDDATSADQSPVHPYQFAERTIVPVKLTVTDNQGLSSSKTAEITVSPAATLKCEDAPGTGQFVSCDLVLDKDSRVTVNLADRSCQAHGNTFEMTAPVPEVLFTDGCYTPNTGPFALNNGAVFAAGTHLKAQVISGALNQVMAPALHVSGSFPQWTLTFDDGVAGPGEPDFNDLVITVTADPVE